MGERKVKLLLIAILLLGVSLRLVNINQSFWLDEASQGQLAAMSVEKIIFERGGDFHPPLFYMLAHYWLQLGRSETWLRLLPISFGIGNIYILYLLADKLFNNKKTALVAAFLLAINSYHIYYSQEFRMYSLLALLGSLSMCALLRRHWSLSIFNTLLLYTHYSSVFLILAQVLYVLFYKKDQIKYYSLHLIITAIAFLPWLPQFLAQLHSGTNINEFLPGWKNVLSVPFYKSMPLILFKFMAGRINIIPKTVYGVYIVFVLGVTFLAIQMAKSKRDLLWSWLFVPIIFSIFVSFLIPQTQPFRLIYALPALILILAQACLKYPRLFLTLLIYISIVGNLLYFTRVRLQREQWRQAIEFLSHQNGIIAVKSSDKFAPFTWYAPELPVVGIVTKYPAQKSQVLENAAQINQKDVYLLEYLTDLTDPARVAEASLKELGYNQKDTYNYEGVGFIYHFSKP